MAHYAGWLLSAHYGDHLLDGVDDNIGTVKRNGVTAVFCDDQLETYKTAFAPWDNSISAVPVSCFVSLKPIIADLLLG